MKIDERQIIKAIDDINDALTAICEELNNRDEIDDYEIELNQTIEQWCVDKKPRKNYQLLVSTIKSIK